MKPKPNKRIDKLLGELGLHPDALDPDEAAADLEKSTPPTPQSASPVPAGNPVTSKEK